MKIILSICIMLNIIFAYTEKMTVKKGWNLRGTTYTIEDLDDFLDDDIVSEIQIYRDGAYTSDKSTLESIEANEGFWIYAKKRGTLEFEADNGDSSDTELPPTFSSALDLEARLDCDWWDGDWWDDWWFNSRFWDKNCDDNGASYDDVSFDLQQGWNLRGTSVSFRINEIFDDSCISNNDSIYVYTSKFYDFDKDSSYNIAGDMGFWVNAKEDCVLDGSNPPEF